MKIFVDGSGTDWSATDDSICLSVDRWNDYSFVTQFGMSVRLIDGSVHQIGAVKIGFKGQPDSVATYERFPRGHLDPLSPEFFSVGQDVSYYSALAGLPMGKGREVLHALRDIVAAPEVVAEISGEKVFTKSLMRDASLTSINGQFLRAMNGAADLTPFKFKFASSATRSRSIVDLAFEVKILSRPSTNIHALIGRNGIGKTTLLNGMIDAIAGTKQAGDFYDLDAGKSPEPKISSQYFSSLVSVSFSAFDPFTPPAEQPDPSKGTCYYYIGLKSPDSTRHLTIPELHDGCIEALSRCLRHEKKRRRWLDAIDKLGSDENFDRMGLKDFVEIFDRLLTETTDEVDFSGRFSESIRPRIAEMSSGHAIILLTITRLVDTVEEKTLILLDEPESHLHPPLLSAFIRALSDLLHDRNGVAIIATHSPVVLQEIPKSCVWKFNRVGEAVTTSRPTIETFAENVGQLTSEVFNLEVRRSGFHAMLEKDVNEGGTYEEILGKYGGQVGLEGRTILSILINMRDRGGRA